MAESRPAPDGPPAELLAALDPGAPVLGRAAAWHELGLWLAVAGSRAQGLVAARTALALRDRSDAPEAELEASRAAVGSLTGPDVVPMHVDLPGGEAGGGRDEARAVWVGAPVDPVLAMLGWVERDGGLDVVRVVVPGTRRGRGSFALLLDALPGCVPVGLRVPARDRALLRQVRAHGFDPVDEDPGGHVGGSVRLRRTADVPPAVPGPRAVAGG